MTMGHESKAEVGKKDDAHACRWQAAAVEHARTCLMPEAAVRNPGQLESLGSRKKVLK